MQTPKFEVPYLQKYLEFFKSVKTSRKSMIKTTKGYQHANFALVLPLFSYPNNNIHISSYSDKLSFSGIGFSKKRKALKKASEN